MKVTVITISSRAAEKIYEDLSGPEIERILKKNLPDVGVIKEIVADNKDEIITAFKKNLSADFIITTGGTGIGPDDVTPEVTEEYCDREIPGIAEILRAESYKETNYAIISRAYAGIKGNTIIVNFPGSVNAVRLCTKILIPVMHHAVRMLRGEGHDSHP